jgi:hypothetical protein
MTYIVPEAPVVGQGVRKSWGQTINDNLADHEERIGDAETSIDDHETRLDSLDGGSATNPTLQIATVTLTDAQIKALPTTAIQIVAAPALNTRVKLIGVTYHAWFENGAYTNVNATSAELYLQTSSLVRLGGYLANDGGVSLTSLTTVLAAASVLTVDGGPYLSNPAGTYVQPLLTGATGSVDGKAVQLFATNNGAGNFTGGHASNLLTVVAYYALEAVPAYTLPFGILVPALVESRRPMRRQKRTPVEQSMPTALL